MQAVSAIRTQIVKRLLRAACKPSDYPSLARLGSEYGGWTIPGDLLHPGGVCYSAGSGEDMSFDMDLVSRYGCEVFAIDPTPRALQYMAKVAANVPQVHLVPLGLWSSSRRMRFYAPKNRLHVSHSITNLQRTRDYFEADCTTVSELMVRNGHRHLDLLKLDIEGAEYEVLRNVIETELRIRILCVEFDQPSPVQRMIGMVRQLSQTGYELVAIEAFNFTFLQSKISD